MSANKPALFRLIANALIVVAFVGALIAGYFFVAVPVLALYVLAPSSTTNTPVVYADNAEDEEDNDFSYDRNLDPTYKAEITNAFYDA